jgi:hypothetical protein
MWIEPLNESSRSDETRVAVGFSPRSSIVPGRRRVATHEDAAGFQSSLRDERGREAISPWTEVHGYPRGLATRGEIRRQLWVGSSGGTDYVGHPDASSCKISVEQVTLFKRDFMFNHERPVFFLEGFGPVVFALRSDIRDHFRNVGFADGECGVAILPCETVESGKGLFDPRGRSAFDQLHRFTDRCVRWDAEQKMDMVFDSTDGEGFQSVLASDASDIRPDSLFDVGTNPSLTIFCAENDMAVQGGEGVCHEMKLKRGEHEVQDNRTDFGGRGGQYGGARRVFNCRYATRDIGGQLIRGLKPTATLVASLREAGSGSANIRIETEPCLLGSGSFFQETGMVSEGMNQ